MKMKSAKNLLKKLNSGNQKLTQDEWNLIESEYFTLKKDSIVRYVGRQKSKSGFKLKKNTTYTISNIFFSKVDESGKLNSKWYENPIPYVSLEEVGEDYSFPQHWFVEVNSTKPITKNISKITVEELTKLMNEAVECEDYDTAITMRDKIKKLIS